MEHSFENEELFSIVATDVWSNTFSCLPRICSLLTKNAIRVYGRGTCKVIPTVCDGACLMAADEKSDTYSFVIVDDGALARLNVCGDVHHSAVICTHYVLRTSDTVHMTRVSSDIIAVFKSRNAYVYMFSTHTGELLRVIDAWPPPYTLDCVWRRTYPASANTYFLVAESLTGITTIQYFMISLVRTYRGQFILACMR